VHALHLPRIILDGRRVRCRQLLLLLLVVLLVVMALVLRMMVRHGVGMLLLVVARGSHGSLFPGLWLFAILARVARLVAIVAKQLIARTVLVQMARFTATIAKARRTVVLMSAVVMAMMVVMLLLLLLMSPVMMAMLVLLMLHMLMLVVVPTVMRMVRRHAAQTLAHWARITHEAFCKINVRITK
jgi:hypothetical protein